MSARQPKVFISYRRAETPVSAAWLYEVLVERFGELNVFMDLKLQSGESHVQQISEVVGSCHILLLVMGPHWADPHDGEGAASISEPNDFVRLEAEMAMARHDVQVLPVLVGGAKMPQPDELPETIRELTQIHAKQLTNERRAEDMNDLVGRVEELLPPETMVHRVPEPAAAPSRSRSIFSRTAERWRDRFRSRAGASPDTPPTGVEPAPSGHSPRPPLPAKDPPRSAYARLEGPDSVVCGEEFEIVVGLAPQAVKGVVGEEMKVPDSVVGPYTLTVHVVADGFVRVDRKDWRMDMPVTAQSPYPAVAVRLVAEPQEAAVRARTLQAVYSIGGQTLGLAVRPIAVLRDAAQRAAETVEPDPGFDFALPEGWIAPDLTVHILGGKEEKAGRLLWTFETPHAGLEVPREGVVVEIGDDPATFSSRLVKKMPTYEGQPGLHDYVVGIGKSVADNVPKVFWSLLAEVAQRSASEAPSVLILSAEPHVPWELAVMDEPLDPRSPPFLSAQARVGRWVLGHRRPKLPPPMSADANSIAVVFGVYDRPNWRRLVEAEAEAADLQRGYDALPVNADSETVLKCIKGDPAADILHFAVHGKYDPSGVQDGLVLVDGRTLDPMVVKGNTFESPRFVFLNACQVGVGDRVLGDYAGMAAAFLYAGAAGVVAPLWSIDDARARQFALDFYQAVFSGAAPADHLRRERSSFREDPTPISSTYIAYQFFGHPDMRLARG